MKKNTDNGSPKSDTTPTDHNDSNIPFCLWQPHREKFLRHLMLDCTQFPKKKKKSFLADLWDRRMRSKGAKRTVVQSVSDAPYTVLFTAPFEERVLETLCANIGTDANFIDQRLIDQIFSSGADVAFEELFPSKVFYLSARAPDGSPSTLICENNIGPRTSGKDAQ